MLTTRGQQRIHGVAGHGVAGYSLLEVLIALLILSFGLIGLAMLQTTGLKYNTGAYGRTQSSLLAHDIIDRMRANIKAYDAGRYTILDDAAAKAAIDLYKPCGTGGGSCNCDVVTCSAENMARYDLGRWYENQARLMPGSSGGKFSTITMDVLKPRLVTITLRWMEDDLQKEQIWEVLL